jgi:4-alpha-glucanotransferase
MAVVNTHDMAPFAAYWQGLDPAHRDRVRAQLAADGAAPAGAEEALDPPAVLEALLGWLGASDASEVVVNLEDLWGEPEPQNVPGTGPEVPNWRRQAALTLEELAADPVVAGRLGRLRATRGTTTRGGGER